MLVNVTFFSFTRGNGVAVSSILFVCRVPAPRTYKFRGVSTKQKTITARLACDIYKVYTDYTASLKGGRGVYVFGWMVNEFNDKIEKMMCIQTNIQYTITNRKEKRKKELNLVLH